jgi:hypothetical protein
MGVHFAARGMNVLGPPLRTSATLVAADRLDHVVRLSLDHADDTKEEYHHQNVGNLVAHDDGPVLRRVTAMPSSNLHRPLCCAYGFLLYSG